MRGNLREILFGTQKAADGFADVDDVNPVARVEDDLFHLGIPTLGLVPEMNT